MRGYKVKWRKIGKEVKFAKTHDKSADSWWDSFVHCALMTSWKIRTFASTSSKYWKCVFRRQYGSVVRRFYRRVVVTGLGKNSTCKFKLKLAYRFLKVKQKYFFKRCFFFGGWNIVLLVGVGSELTLPCALDSRPLPYRFPPLQFFSITISPGYCPSRIPPPALSSLASRRLPTFITLGFPPSVPPMV